MRDSKDEIKLLEAEYLRAKIEYYEGTPIMSDAAFDLMEKKLIAAGSKVHEQVGSKRKDFDFAHPTKLLSLSKVQTEKNEDGSTNYMEAEFLAWYKKRIKALGKGFTLFGSPKFDGSSINITYHGRKIYQVATRGDGFTGKDVTKRFLPYIDNNLSLTGLSVTDEDIIQIRCEVVIDKALFEEKYFGKPEDGKFANPRNYVAGVIGKDDYDELKVSELTVIPLHFILNREHVSQKHFLNTPFCQTDYNVPFDSFQYIDMIKYYEKYRETAEFMLDGVVIAFPTDVRAQLGENDHDPEWSYAVKFIPEDAITTVNGIEWNVGKRGQLTPVILLDPVQLAGTTVKRASGYNAGYLKDNGIWIGAIVSVAKAGDIIPEIQKVEMGSIETFVLPHKCPSCESKLTFDGIHLMCNNESCGGRISKKLATAGGLLDLKGVGSERLKPFAEDFMNMFELMKWVLTYGDSKEIEKYGIEFGSRSHEIFVDAFKNIKSLPYENVVQLLGYENVGRKISKQLAREHAGLDFSYASLEKALVEKLHTDEVRQYVLSAVSDLESLGVTVDRPEASKVDNTSIGVCLTGSPKPFGFKTKGEFLAKYTNLFEVDLKDAKYLVTDDLNSSSSKMTNAKKKGIEIKTYGNF